MVTAMNAAKRTKGLVLWMVVGLAEVRWLHPTTVKNVFHRLIFIHINMLVRVFHEIICKTVKGSSHHTLISLESADCLCFL